MVPVDALPDMRGVEARTMGRESARTIPAFFLAAAAAGMLAAEAASV